MVNSQARFFFTRNGKPQGPVSSTQLKRLARSGQLKPTDKVKKQGTTKWLAASSIAGLFDVSSQEVDNSDETAAQRSVVLLTCIGAGGLVALACAVLVVLWAVGSFSVDKPDADRAQNASNAQADNRPKSVDTSSRDRDREDRENEQERKRKQEDERLKKEEQEKEQARKQGPV